MVSRRLLRWAARGLRLSTLVTLTLAGWMMLNTPIGAYWGERSTAEVKLALDRLVFREFDAEWYNDTILESISDRPVDWALVQSAEAIAQERGLTLTPEVSAGLAVARARDKSFRGQAENCIACAAGDPDCRVGDGLFCALGVEMTPIGDARALYTEGRAYLSGQPVDRINVALAGIGLGATATLLVSGGSSAALKGGVALVRVARRAGRLSPGLQARLARIGATLVDFDKLPQTPRAMLDPDAYRAAVNSDVLSRGTALFGDLERVGTALPNAHALAVLPLIDNAGDARRIARLAEAGGARTLAVTHRLGKARAMRLTARLSRAGSTAIQLALALGLQALALLGTIGFSGLQRALASLIKSGAR